MCGKEDMVKILSLFAAISLCQNVKIGWLLTIIAIRNIPSRELK